MESNIIHLKTNLIHESSEIYYLLHENLLNSPSRGNLVDGLPRAESFGGHFFMKMWVSFSEIRNNFQFILKIYSKYE